MPLLFLVLSPPPPVWIAAALIAASLTPTSVLGCKRCRLASLSRGGVHSAYRYMAVLGNQSLSGPVEVPSSFDADEPRQLDIPHKGVCTLCGKPYWPGEVDHDSDDLGHDLDLEQGWASKIAVDLFT